MLVGNITRCETYAVDHGSDHAAVDTVIALNLGTRIPTLTECESVAGKDVKEKARMLIDTSSLILTEPVGQTEQDTVKARQALKLRPQRTAKIVALRTPRKPNYVAPKV
jgi:hypothetical protein